MGSTVTPQELEKTARSMICAHARQSNMGRYEASASKYDEVIPWVQYLWSVGYNAQDIAAHLGVFRAQVYRIFDRMERMGYPGRQGVRGRRRRLDLPPLKPADR